MPAEHINAPEVRRIRHGGARRARRARARRAPARAARRSGRRAAGAPESRAATMRPRAQRSLSSKRSAPRRGAGGAGPPAARVAQPSRTGQSPQRGARGRHTVAPSSIIAWLNSAARPAGSSSAARSPSAAGVRDLASKRSITRRAFVSIAATWRSQAKEPTAAAVYGPDAGQLGQVLRPAVRGDASRRGLERQGPAVVAEPAPCCEDVARWRFRQGLGVRESLEERLVVRDDAGGLGLLEHHLAHEQRVGVARGAPWEGAAVVGVPREELGRESQRRLGGEGGGLDSAARVVPDRPTPPPSVPGFRTATASGSS